MATIPHRDDNEKMCKLAELLGLDPNKIKRITAEMDGNHVVVQYDGVIMLPFDRYVEIMNEVYE